jgi:hypothetical protein
MSLPRRTFLRGMGVTVALPLLEAMVPALTATARTAANPVRRFGAVYVPHGKILDQWTPAGDGAGFAFTPILKPLEAHRDQLCVVSGLDGPKDPAAGGHATAPAMWLTGASPKKTEGVDVRNDTTIDQLIAKAIGQETPFPSLELATEDFTGFIGACDVGYSCTYMNTIAWAGPTAPLPMEINPRVVFERLFGDGTSAEERLAGRKQNASILDSVTQELGVFKRDLGAGDRARLDTYLENVTELERRIRIAMENSVKEPNEDVPFGLPESKHVHFRLMYDLMALAYQANITRVFTYMVAREESNKTYPMIDVHEGHHATSHHQNRAEKIEKLVKIQTYHVGLFADFVNKLNSIQDGDGTLLDHSLILFGSNMSNSNTHNHFPLPNVVVGRAAGNHKGGRHLKYPDHTPMTNLLLTMLDTVGVHQDKLGDSTGRLSLPAA